MKTADYHVTKEPGQPIPSEKPIRSDDLTCGSCGMLWGRCNGRWVEGQPPRPGIVEAMKRPIPSDAGRCHACGLDADYGATVVLGFPHCCICGREIFKAKMDRDEDAIREFHGPWQGGLGDD